jgi:hypothetical protein
MTGQTAQVLLHTIARLNDTIAMMGRLADAIERMNALTTTILEYQRQAEMPANRKH